MKKEWYKFANQLDLSNEVVKKEELDEMAKKRYERNVLAAIRKEQTTQNNTNRSTGKKRKGAIAAAACLVLLGGTLAIFHEEVHAAISHISYSISAALGLENDLAQYTEVVNTSVSDKGYVVTLQEAIAAPEKLVISYTAQREDGQPLTDYLSLDAALYVNGSRIYGGAGGQAGFLDDEKKILGCETSYDIPDIDLSGENTYELRFTASLDSYAGEDIGGHWDFKFKADGMELFSNTKHMSLGNEFTLPNGGSIILDTFSDNELEQRITFHTSGTFGRYDVMLTATDEQGRIAEFYISRFGDGKGYMLNSQYIENGRILGDAKTVTVTASAVELPENDGKIPDDYVQLGEPFIWDMTNLK